jgi:hypothetical protein
LSAKGTVPAMCDALTTKDGIMITTVGEARRYGIAMPDTAFATAHGDQDCLCGTDLAAALNEHPSLWNDGFFDGSFGYAEVDVDGRTWFDGYDMESPDPDYPRMIRVARSDGRSAITLEQWEAQRATKAAQRSDLVFVLRNGHGQDCRCAAHCACECACQDALWAQHFVGAAADEIDRLRALIRDYVTMEVAYQDELADARSGDGPLREVRIEQAWKDAWHALEVEANRDSGK